MKVIKVLISESQHKMLLETKRRLHLKSMSEAMRAWLSAMEP